MGVEMAFVTQYQYDIFVSYAHVDDQPLPGAEEGWVSTLVTGVRTLLAKELGQSDAFELWIDQGLSRHVQITPQIMDTLRKTAIILVIMSPGYIASKWCQREKETFLRFIKERVSSGSRMFIVEHNMIDDSARPDEFRELLGYRFWVKDREGKSPRTLGLPKPDPLDHRYYDLLTDLSLDLAGELKRLRNLEDGIIKESSQGKGIVPTIFLAEVTDDLEPQRDKVKRYLHQHGLNILPDSWYPREPSQFQQSMKSDLDKSVLFVQLISEITGKRPPRLSKTYARLQYDCAVKSGKPILQWRNRNLDITTITDKDHSDFLGMETVMAVGFEEFKRAIVERAFYKPPPSKKESVHAFIFVNMESNDRALAECVCKCLEHFGAEYVLPLIEGKPAEIRQDLESNLLECDGIIIVYGKITVTWVREQLRQCRKILARRERPLKALAVYEGPPEPKLPLDLKLQNMQIIDCRKCFNEDELKAFIDCLKED